MARYESEFGEWTVEYRPDGTREYITELEEYIKMLLNLFEYKTRNQMLTGNALKKLGEGAISEWMEDVDNDDLADDLQTDLKKVVSIIVKDVQNREFEEERASERRAEERAGVYGEREPEEYYDSDFRYGSGGDY